jgi:hypothetical protein
MMVGSDDSTLRGSASVCVCVCVCYNMGSGYLAVRPLAAVDLAQTPMRREVFLSAIIEIQRRSSTLSGGGAESVCMSERERDGSAWESFRVSAAIEIRPRSEAASLLRGGVK